MNLPSSSQNFMAERFLASLCLVLVAMAQAGAPLAGGPQVAAFGELEAVKPANLIHILIIKQ